MSRPCVVKVYALSILEILVNAWADINIVNNRAICDISLVALEDWYFYYIVYHHAVIEKLVQKCSPVSLKVRIIKIPWYCSSLQWDLYMHRVIYLRQSVEKFSSFPYLDGVVHIDSKQKRIINCWACSTLHNWKWVEMNTLNVAIIEIWKLVEKDRMPMCGVQWSIFGWKWRLSECTSSDVKTWGSWKHIMSYIWIRK